MLVMFNLLFRRGVAFLIDALMLVVIFFGNFGFIMSAFSVSIENPLQLNGLLAMVALQLLYVWIYFVYVPVKMPGQTVGKKLMKIKELRADGKEMTLKQYFQRDFMMKFLLSSLTRGFIVLFNGILLVYQCIRKQELCTLHDMVVRTQVVRVK